MRESRHKRELEKQPQVVCVLAGLFHGITYHGWHLFTVEQSKFVSGQL